ncbi:MAG: type II toxin-antitoxin system VapC family toxin [Geminicoccaceae bacterium]
MIAVDTNVVVRFLARDDPAQSPRAKALMETGSVFVLRTVVLETEWVLRTTYGFDRAAIADGVTKLLGLPGVEVEEAAMVAQALDWYGKGLDFADALHLASSGRAEAFATFDRALRRKVRAIAGTVPVVAP